MIKPLFEYLEIEFWVHPGKLGSARPSLCLFHDTAQAGRQLLDALKEIKGEIRPAQCTLTFTACARTSALRKMKLMLVPEREELKVMNIHHNAETATIEMTDEGLALMTDAVTLWLTGAEDFGVSSRHSPLKPKQFGELDRESGELWFWGPGYAGP